MHYFFGVSDTFLVLRNLIIRKRAAVDTNFLGVDRKKPWEIGGGGEVQFELFTHKKGWTVNFLVTDRK